MSDDGSAPEEGGESACFAHLICPDCGVVLDGAEHLQSCEWPRPEIEPDAIFP